MKRFYLIFLLYLLACRIPSPISTSSLGNEEIPLNVPTDPKVILHPKTNPIPAEQIWDNPISPLEIDPKKFIVARAHQGQINAIAVGSGGKCIYSGGHDGQVVRTCLTETGGGSTSPLENYALQSEVILAGTKPILALSLSQDNRFLVISQFSYLAVFDLKRRQITNRMTQVKGRILTVTWDPRGELIVFGRANGEVFVWNLKHGKYAGENSPEAIERYTPGSSPLVSVFFHPTGRAFFSAERDGAIFFRRLIRTEQEMGLRDAYAVGDQRQEGETQKRVSQLPAQIEDLWLNNDASQLFATSANGYIYRWKIRGLKAKEPIFVGQDSVFSLQGIELTYPDNAKSQETTRLKLLATSGNGQRIKFWCQEPTLKALKNPQGSQGIPVVKDDQQGAENVSEDLEGEEDSLSDEIAELKAEEDKIKAEEILAKTPKYLIAESVLLRNPIHLVRSDNISSVLWAAEKTGNLLAFDTKSLLKSDLWLSRARACQDVNISPSPQED